ncbi:hypothetical protein D3C86_1867480 [compost metagenome]
MIRHGPGKVVSIFFWFRLSEDIAFSLNGFRDVPTVKIEAFRFFTSVSSMMNAAVPKSVSVWMTAVRSFPPM